jgi:tetrahydromethanopterin S-methyltransferase subunit A
MPETTTEVRADIEQTRERMSGAIAELERKVDVTQKVRDHPWAAVAVAFSAGVALSASRADVRAAQVTSQATKDTGSKLGGALDGVVAALIAGVTEAFHSRIDGMVADVVTSIRGDSGARTIGLSERGREPPIRAD